jgi:SprT-like family
MAAQKIPSSIPLNKLCIISVVILAYFTGTRAPHLIAHQTAAMAWQKDCLEKKYKQDNTKYFGNQLPPEIQIQIAEIEPENGEYFLGQTRRLWGSYIVTIDPRLNIAGQTAAATLLHEECHIWLQYQNGDPDREHGATFQACEQKLMDENAMKDLF